MHATAPCSRVPVVRGTPKCHAVGMTFKIRMAHPNGDIRHCIPLPACTPCRARGEFSQYLLQPALINDVGRASMRQTAVKNSGR